MNLLRFGNPYYVDGNLNNFRTWLRVNMPRPIVRFIAIVCILLISACSDREEIKVENLSSDELFWLEELRNNKNVDVPLNSFRALAVLSEVITESEIDHVIDQSLEYLQAEDEYFIDGERESISFEGKGNIFIFGTKKIVFFQNARSGLLKVLLCLKRGREGDVEFCKSVNGVKIKMRGKEAFYDIQGLSGLNNGAWLGFDLRD